MNLNKNVKRWKNIQDESKKIYGDEISIRDIMDYFCWDIFTEFSILKKRIKELENKLNNT